MVKNNVTRESIFEYVYQQYHTFPEYPLELLPTYAVLRHPNGNWYGIVMSISNQDLNLEGNDPMDILITKYDQRSHLNPLMESKRISVNQRNKEHWIPSFLNGSTNMTQAYKLLDSSYLITGQSFCHVPHRYFSESWIVPVNPKFYDLKSAFATNDEIIWKQSNNMLAGDTVYLYTAAPVSSILYRCTVLKANIPYYFDNGKVHMKRVMHIKLKQEILPPLPLSKLKEHGIFSVRGPIRMPYGLRYELGDENHD